ncbi:THUMP domain-containing protein [Aromatoleum toluclasticum]|uniref:THUMP domain-containing class I SAM-dependent RNA methyltransferase n=1 Tax=Aromatoleum toluclasticum TaxID=92003 RepID=UPI001D190C04|nr:THUMP domain-containing protein [Aromatoleum toluclasticum]MCC4115428.1 THUMP domain-containing protein [Aromatoleum toluclasticum]
MSESFFSPCPRGLEPMLAEELTALGARDVEATHGGVGFSGDWQTCYRANLESRIATRVMWRLAQGRYQSEEDIYRLAYGATWAKWFTVDDTIRIYVTAKQSPLRSLEFVTLKIKDAVCDHFRTVTGKRPSVDTADPAVRIHAFLTRDRVTLYLDTSGEPLYKRGYKPAAVEAPLKENLAAGILRITGWRPGEALIDPMCGSGTFLIEAAQIALDIAPGLGRRFAFERFRHFDRAAWASIRQAAEARRKSPRPLRIYGSDVVGEQVRRSRVNLQAAGLADCVTLDRADFLAREAPAEEGVMVTNPPYGVRIGEAEELAALYPQFGDALKKRWSGWRCYFLSADPALPKLIGLKASKRTPLFNGALECRVFEYKMVAGTNRRKAAEEG